MSIVVSISETYDLSTKKDKMSIVGVHTPSKDLIAKTYPGLAINSKMFKFVKCDVRMACAQMLPADPLQVGTSAGKVAPQDMFNPILYKAMSNEAMNNFELRVHGMRADSVSDRTPAFEGESIIADNQGLGNGVNDEQIYYNLLANHKGWKIAHPQRGLQMASLRPYVYEKLFDVGQNTGDTTTQDEDTYNVLAMGSQGDGYIRAQVSRGFRGKARPMPAINCTHLTNNSSVSIAFAGNTEKLQQDDIPDIKPIYVACLVLPPSKLNILYYRLVVRWKIAFLGIRPIQEIMNWGTMQYDSSTFYGRDYTYASKDMDSKLDMVDAEDADIEKVMEGI